MRKGRLLRPESKQERRFLLTPNAPKNINSAVTIAEHCVKMNKDTIKTHGKKEIHTAHADFWSLKKERNAKIITIIIRQARGGKKYFLSIF